MRFALKALVGCVLAGMIASSGNSQQITASIRGTVVDASGAVVSSANWERGQRQRVAGAAIPSTRIV